MTGRNYDFDDLHPLGDTSGTPEHRLKEHSAVTPRRQIDGRADEDDCEKQTDAEQECRSCGTPISVSQTRCRFCIANRLDDASAGGEDSRDYTLGGIVYMLVESTTFYGAVAKGAAAGNLLVTSKTEEAIKECRLSYDLDETPAPQLVDRWSSLPDATVVSSADGEQLLTAIRQRMSRQDCSAHRDAQEGQTCLYDESGSALSDASRLDTVLESAGNPLWLVPAITLREMSEE